MCIRETLNVNPQLMAMEIRSVEVLEQLMVECLRMLHRFVVQNVKKVRLTGDEIQKVGQSMSTLKDYVKALDADHQRKSPKRQKIDDSDFVSGWDLFTTPGGGSEVDPIGTPTSPLSNQHIVNFETNVPATDSIVHNPMSTIQVCTLFMFVNFWVNK